MIAAMHIELDGLCLLVLCAIAYQSKRSVNQQMNHVLFRCLVYGVIVQLALDILWRIIEGRVFPGAVWANRIVNALYLPAGVVLGCVWYLYVLETLGTKITKRLQALMMLPGLVFIVLNLISIWTEWIFTVSEDNVYAHGEWFWLQMIGAYGMLTASFVHILSRVLWGTQRVPRRAAAKLLGFYIIPVIGSLVSLLYTGMPGAWTCASVSLALIYIDDQDSEIVRDSLTGLNNRKTLDTVYEEYARQSTVDRMLYLFMLDLDDFKKINDTLGHSVGDQALVAAARVLTGSMAGRKGYIARYGGDEFLIMSFFQDYAQATEFRSTIQENFAAYRKEHDLPYRLSVSAGFAQYARGAALDDLVRQADAELYRNKKENRK